MAESTGRNQGVHSLDDFVCDAILAAPANFGPTDKLGQGQNQGVAPIETVSPEKPVPGNDSTSADKTGLEKRSGS